MTLSIIAEEIEILNKYRIKKVSYSIDIVDIPTDKKNARHYYSTLKIDLSLYMENQSSEICLPLSYLYNFTSQTLKKSPPLNKFPSEIVLNMVSSITVDNIDSNNIIWTTCKTDGCNGGKIECLKINIMDNMCENVYRVKNKPTHLNIKYNILTPQPLLPKNKKTETENVNAEESDDSNMRDIFTPSIILLCLKRWLETIRSWINQQKKYGVKNNLTNLNLKHGVISPQPPLLMCENKETEKIGIKKSDNSNMGDVSIPSLILFCLRQDLATLHIWIKQKIYGWIKWKIPDWIKQKIPDWIKQKIRSWIKQKIRSINRDDSKLEKNMRHFKLPIIDSRHTNVISFKFSSPIGWKFADVTNINPVTEKGDDIVHCYGDCPIRYVNKKVPLSYFCYGPVIDNSISSYEKQLIPSSISSEDLFLDIMDGDTKSMFTSHNWEYSGHPKKSTWVVDIYKKNMWKYAVKNAQTMYEMMCGCKFKKRCVLPCDKYQKKLEKWYFTPCNNQSSKTEITAGSYILRDINFKIEAGSKNKLTVALSRCLLILSILFGIIFVFSLITTSVDKVEWINYIFADIGQITVVVAFFFSYCLEKENGMQFYVSDRRIQNQIIISALVSIFCAVLLIIRFTISL